MAVLEKPLARAHDEIDIVTTPAGDLVAMVHCNNGGERARVVGRPVRTVRGRGGRHAERGRRLRRAAAGISWMPTPTPADSSPTTTSPASRSPDSPKGARWSCARLTAASTLANFMRAQVYGVFGTLALGMQVLEREGVELDPSSRTAGSSARPASRSASSPARSTRPSSSARPRPRAGAWGIAVLAAYLSAADDLELDPYLRTPRLRRRRTSHHDPRPEDVAGFTAYLHRYRGGLAIESAAVAAL